MLYGTDDMSLLIDSDSYKGSHFMQYPPKSEIVEAYLESRGGGAKILWAGMQGLCEKYLTKPITMEQVDEASAFYCLHKVPFNYEGWKYIVDEHDGYLPIEIETAPEGYRIPTRNVLAVIRNTDPKCYWLTNFLETMLLRVWYPTTVATLSNEIKQAIWGYEEETCDTPLMDIRYKVHDFGSRGVTCREQAAIGGFAHLINFHGSDTMAGVWYANKHYRDEMAGTSISASEHSTITSWGRENEVDAYRNMLEKYKDEFLVACVMDSYDVEYACDQMLGVELKDLITKREGLFVARPDSGDPVEIVFKLIDIFDKRFGHTVNKKGYKVLNHMRIIQGDGINIDTVREILGKLKRKQWSVENVNFGIGGALLQRNIDRDTFKFATKCSAIRIGGEWRDVYKDPKGSSFKASKRGRLALHHWIDEDGTVRVQTVTRDQLQFATTNLLRPVFRNGKMLKTYTLDEVRRNTDVVVEEF